KVPNIEKNLKEDLELNYTEGGGQTLFQRLLLPSLTVKGLNSGNVGSLARNVIPNTAVASLSMRLVKGNDPEEMLTSWKIISADRVGILSAPILTMKPE